MANIDLMMDGFERYGSTTGAAGEPPLQGRWSTFDISVINSGHASAPSGGIKTGTYVAHCGNTQGIWTLAAAISEAYFGFARHTQSVPSQRNFFAVRDGGTTHINIRENTDRTVSAVNGDGTVLGTTTEVMSATWTYIEVYVKVDDAAGVVTIKFNGTEVLALTAVDTRNGGNATFDRFPIGGGTTNTWFDDLYASSLGFAGPIGIYNRAPSGAGTVAQFTRGGSDSGFNWSQVDEVGPNSDTDYNLSSTVGHKDSYAAANLPDSAGAVRGVDVYAFAKKSDTGSRTFKNRIISGGNPFSGSSKTPTTDYLYYDNLWAQDPDTSADWIQADVDALEIGLEVV